MEIPIAILSRAIPKVIASPTPMVNHKSNHTTSTLHCLSNYQQLYSYPNLPTTPQTKNPTTLQIENEFLRNSNSGSHIK